MKVAKEQLQDFAAQENAMFWDNIVIDKIIEQAIPIYTDKHPNPKSGKKDCNITKREKEHFRQVMKMKLQAAKTQQERQGIIDHYKSKWSE